MKKSNNNWKVLNIFGELWSAEYGGAIYPRSGRDLRATKELLELYPDLFSDEALQMELRLWIGNYLKEPFWYKPNEHPPLKHQFYYFVDHLSKYTDAQKKVEKKQAVKRRLMVSCGLCGENHYADEYHECSTVKKDE